MSVKKWKHEEGCESCEVKDSKTRKVNWQDCEGFKLCPTCAEDYIERKEEATNG